MWPCGIRKEPCLAGGLGEADCLALDVVAGNEHSVGIQRGLLGLAWDKNRHAEDTVGITPEGQVEVEEIALPLTAVLASLRGSREKG